MDSPVFVYNDLQTGYWTRDIRNVVTQKVDQANESMPSNINVWFTHFIFFICSTIKLSPVRDDQHRTPGRKHVDSIKPFDVV